MIKIKYLVTVTLLMLGCANEGKDTRNEETQGKLKCTIVPIDSGLPSVSEEPADPIQTSAATMIYTSTVCNKLPVISVGLFTEEEGLVIKDKFVLHGSSIYQITPEWITVWFKVNKATGEISESCKVRLREDNTVDSHYPN